MNGKFGFAYPSEFAESAVEPEAAEEGVLLPVQHASDWGESKCNDEGTIVYVGLTDKAKNEQLCVKQCIRHHEILHVEDGADQVACDQRQKALKEWQEIQAKALRRVGDDHGGYKNLRARAKALKDGKGAWLEADKAYKLAHKQAECRAWLGTIECFKKMDCTYGLDEHKDRREKECKGVTKWIRKSWQHARDYCDHKKVREKMKEAPD